MNDIKSRSRQSSPSCCSAWRSDWQQLSCLCECKGEVAEEGLRKAHLPLSGHLSPGHSHPRAPLQKEHDVLMRVGSLQGQTPELIPRQADTCWVKQILGVSYFLFAKVCQSTS